MTGLSRFNRATIGVLMLAAVGTAGLGTPAAAQAGAPDYAALIAAPDRSAADREADKRRDPVPFLAFAGLRGGMKVLDMGAGGGYSTELVARAVAPTGTAYGQNPPGLFERAQAALVARLMTPRPDELTTPARSSVAPASRSMEPVFVNRPPGKMVTVPVETRSDPWFVNVPEGVMTNCPPPVLSSTPVLTTERLTPRGTNWLLPR